MHYSASLPFKGEATVALRLEKEKKKNPNMTKNMSSNPRVNACGHMEILLRLQSSMGVRPPPTPPVCDTRRAAKHRTSGPAYRAPSVATRWSLIIDDSWVQVSVCLCCTAVALHSILSFDVFGGKIIWTPRSPVCRGCTWQEGLKQAFLMFS